MDDLVKAAIAARSRAYVPYSNHAVGAAILDDQGNIHLGANVENAAYPESQCAEASAIGVMIAAGGRRIEAIAIAGPGPDLCTPCGGCRQRIREFASEDTPVLIADPGGEKMRFTIGELLPAAFGPENL
ncbi:MAG: cytidine deaminase [Pseudomonadota bacterium]